MDNITNYKKIDIEKFIYKIRDKQVMIDSALVCLYKCVNRKKAIELVVKQHINRFSERFMFQLTEDEYNFLRSQLGTLKNGRGREI